MTTGEIISLGALGISLIVMVLTARRDTRGSAQESGEIRGKLDSISNGIDDIRVDLRTMRDKQQDMAVRLAETEASCRSMHRRLEEHVKQYHHTDA